MQQQGRGHLTGRVALITGAASGIGRATAARFAAEGAAVVVADINATAAEATATALRDGGGRAEAQALDVRSEVDWQAAIARLQALYGRLDVLVNNAGILIAGDIETATLEDFRAIQQVNVEGVFLGCREAVRAMRENRDPDGGAIVNVSSVAGLVGAPNLPAYCASKGAVRLLTKSVALHCARKGYGVRCNSVHPSFVDTPMVERLVADHRDPTRYRAALDRAAPLGGLASAEQVAAAILYLAGDDAAFVTGSELVVDGGATAA